MTDPSVVNSTFTIEREYAATPARVFAAWADPSAKARWFGGTAAESHELDFRVGGVEITQGRNGEGKLLIAESRYHDIVPDQRVVYTTTLSVEDTSVTVSLTTVQLEQRSDGTTLLRLTEHGAFLDGHEQPEWREQGTSDQLTALDAELASADTAK